MCHLRWPGTRCSEHNKEGHAAAALLPGMGVRCTHVFHLTTASCIHTYMYACMHTWATTATAGYIHTYIYTYIHTWNTNHVKKKEIFSFFFAFCIWTCMQAWIDIIEDVTYIYIYTIHMLYTHTKVNMYECVYACMNVWIYVSVRGPC